MKLYRKVIGSAVEVRDTDFEGAQEITVFPYEEIVSQLQNYYDKNNKYYSADGAFTKFCQNGEGADVVGTQYSETRFSLPYCGEDEEDFRKAFGGDEIYEYHKLIWEEDDGEWEANIADDTEPYFMVL